jgi:hypothetical protein
MQKGHRQLAAQRSRIMKYFSIEWWSGHVDDAQSAFIEYRKYIDQILVNLLPDLRNLRKKSAFMTLAFGSSQYCRRNERQSSNWMGTL